MSEEITKSVEYWSKHYLESLARKGEKPEFKPLFHGTRRKEPIEEIKSKGICTFKSEVEAKMEIIHALRHFGKERYLTRTGDIGERVRYAIERISSPYRRVIWATTFGDRTCGWAARNPEIIMDVLWYVGVSEEDTAKYLRERFGKCYKIKLKHQLPYDDPNLPLRSDCLKPEDIGSVEKCGEFEEGVHCDEDGSCK